jgi:hypothetical protein
MQTAAADRTRLRHSPAGKVIEDANREVDAPHDIECAMGAFPILGSG